MSPRFYRYFILPEKDTKYLVMKATSIECATLFFAQTYGKLPALIRVAKPLEVSFYEKEVGEVIKVDI